MTERQQIEAFADDLDRLVGRYCDEFELTSASAISVLAFKMHSLMSYAQRKNDEQEEPE